MNACPKCGGAMEPGFVVDRFDDGRFSAPEWAEGSPERSFWTGLKLRGRERHAVRTLRCERCGFLESYAGASEGSEVK